MTDDLRLRIARELTTITSLYADLHAEALHRPANEAGLYIPGGDAQVMAGPAARYGEWERQIDAAEDAWFNDLTDVWIELADDDGDPAPPLLVLGKWDEKVRAERGQPTGLRLTVNRAADYLRNSLDWIVGATDGRPNFMPADQLAHDLTQLRIRLEAVLHDGIRHDHTATVCLREHPPESEQTCGGQLVRRTLDRRDCDHARKAIQVSKAIRQDPVNILRIMLKDDAQANAHKGCDQGGRDDVYRCYTCGGYYTEAEYWLAVKEQYERQAG